MKLFVASLVLAAAFSTAPALADTPTPARPDDAPPAVESQRSGPSQAGEGARKVGEGAGEAARGMGAAVVDGAATAGGKATALGRAVASDAKSAWRSAADWLGGAFDAAMGTLDRIFGKGP